MKILRILLGLYAGLCIMGGIGLAYAQLTKGGWYWIVAAFLLVNAFVIALDAIFEKGRYRPKTISQDGWQKTSERFIDDSSGKLMEVYFNPKTGERSYREVGSKT